MARPKSEEKNQALLDAAAQAIAAEGLAASTARIARIAGVAEGTLFRYFTTKDELLNALYLHLKSSLCRSILDKVDLSSCPPPTFMNHLWHNYIDWGVANPEGYLALRQLAVSDKITEETRAQVASLFPQRREKIEQGMQPIFRSDPFRAFSDEIYMALAEATMKFITRDPARTEEFKQVGFETLWRALGKA